MKSITDKLLRQQVLQKSTNSGIASKDAVLQKQDLLVNTSAKVAKGQKGALLGFDKFRAKDQHTGCAVREFNEERSIIWGVNKSKNIEFTDQCFISQKENTKTSTIQDIYISPPLLRGLDSQDPTPPSSPSDTFAEDSIRFFLQTRPVLRSRFMLRFKLTDEGQIRGMSPADLFGTFSLFRDEVVNSHNQKKKWTFWSR